LPTLLSLIKNKIKNILKKFEKSFDKCFSSLGVIKEKISSLFEFR
jgi:hypothetical protein